MNVITAITNVPRQRVAAIILFIGILASVAGLLISWQESKIESRNSGIEYYEDLVKRIKLL